MVYQASSELDGRALRDAAEPAFCDAPAGASEKQPLLRLSVWQLLPPIALLGLAIFAAALLRVPIAAITAHIPLTYNEGWNALHTQRLMSGGPLYPPIGADSIINYPPLSFYVVGALGKVVGDYIVAGRILALLSLFVVAGNVGLIVRALGAKPQLALLASLVFLVFATLFFSDYVAADDPQWFGHALQTTGLLLLLRRPAATTARLVVVALLLAAGGLVKQDLVILPLAVTVWLLIVDRRALLRWLGICATIVCLTLAGLILLYGQNFVTQVLLSERNFSTEMLVQIVNVYAPRMAAYFIFAAAAVAVRPADRRVWLLAIYFGLGTVLGLAMTTATGVIYSALFDMTIAMMIAATVTMQWIAERLDESGWRWGIGLGAAAAAMLLLLPLRGAIDGAFNYSNGLTHQLNAATEWQDAIDRLAGEPGPVACESLALCYWAGRRGGIDFFNFAQYTIRHPGFGQPTISAIDGRRFALIQMDFVEGSIRFTGDLNDLLADRYQPEQTIPTVLLTPRP